MRKGVKCIDAVGFEAVGHLAGNMNIKDTNSIIIKPKDISSDGIDHDHSKISNPSYLPSNPLQVITWIIQVAKKYSTVSIPGVYASGYDQFPLGLFFNQNLSIKMGQCPVKKYNEQLLHLIETKRMDPTKIISHTMNLDESPKAYEMFNKREDVTKIVLKP